ncbi:hypothetical protein SAMD00079811_11790 [Scytonema sp. HK-05]|uniref:hypothetical protein n=1 Tax=Scytonema sp. HK-05 TaxID=1137095 RepID=UPI000937567C|nr:hypothetical protein [Scytonema sp. HK-05]OKH60226.1 hypothetical protein NIES2130_03895 [Scytonema sp. HK-05]BAY43599.1 hypothetical protein SAMD00079811_11790 [Scytonema sp. HK-05]
MVNIGYHTAKFQGQFIRSLYRNVVVKLVNLPIKQNRKAPIKVYSLSCERDLPEQVVSIRSFIRHVGIPDTFTVISDGSYTDDSCRLLRRIHPCVEVVPLKELLRSDLPQCVSEYAQLHAMGRKLSALMSIPVDGPTIYTDSDILFFPGGIDLVELATPDDKYTRYLPDCSNSLDERIIYDDSEKLNPINAGFILFKHELDWSFAIERLANIKGVPGYFTEQTVVHLTIHHNQGKPLCSQRYILNVEDQFIYPDKFASKEIALRHYVRDVRHKFWFNLAFT